MLKIVSAALICLLPALATQAEQIIVPVGQQAVYNQHLERPKTGVSKANVLEKYGEPNQRVAAVGEPPISSWEYDKFTVYFEFDHVVHTVLKVDETLVD